MAEPVAAVDDAIRQIADDMLETMYEDSGIGLAATQVGIAKRIIVMDLSPEMNQPQVFINPEITQRKGTQLSQEGCLSVPGYYEEVERAAKITWQALDAEGNQQTYDGEDLLAVCVQHEIDHLDGKLFVDYLSPLKRQRIRKKMEKTRKRNL
tara:strand:+ start:136300 stop:136755 length:456 start_codon:yes stop_codon:yes gene_type:complete